MDITRKERLKITLKRHVNSKRERGKQFAICKMSLSEELTVRGLAKGEILLWITKNRSVRRVMIAYVSSRDIEEEGEQRQR